MIHYNYFFFTHKLTGLPTVFLKPVTTSKIRFLTRVIIIYNLTVYGVIYNDLKKKKHTI